MRPGQKLWSLGKHEKTASVAEYRMKAYRRFMTKVLAPQPGEHILDVGCGSGPDFGWLSEHVGPEGRVLGVDITEELVERAKRRITKAGWTNVEVIQGDATKLAVEGFDAAVAAYSLSATHDVPATMRCIHAALKPGGRLVALDVRLEAKGPSALIVRGLGALYRRIAGWTGVEVLDAAREVFSEVTPLDGRGNPQQEPLPGWPPLVNFIATR